MPIVHPEELVWRSFSMQTDTGQLQHIKIVEALEDHQQHLSNHPPNIQFKCSVNYDEYEEVMSYNQILDHLNKDTDKPIVWKFKNIIAHQRPLDPKHKDYKGSTYNVSIE